MSDGQHTTPLEYLKDRVGAVARGKPVRDLDEAIAAVCAENERLRSYARAVVNHFRRQGFADLEICGRGEDLLGLERTFPDE